MENPSVPVMSIKDWMITILVTAIPLVGFVMLFVWAFGGGSTNPNKQNWAKATLIWFAIVIALYLIILMVFGAAFLSNYDDFDF
ncbi:hypothetical protein [Cecembia sp.]|uniref:hypothetical protein n=1 Tax=Cecembia sp. TaxID=1898110 RepID=UPI0025BDE511|nr:hypothetical protein [Cecembia sp.]